MAPQVRRPRSHAAWVASKTVKQESIASLDPGLLNPAVAVFRDGTLVAASRVPAKSAWAKLCRGERCRLNAKALYQYVLGTGIKPCRLATEWPQIYTREKLKGDPNDLPPMCGVAVGLGCLLDAPVESYLPREWLSGTCPKSTDESEDPFSSPRGQRVRAALSEAEVATVVPSHDAVDAVGIGLFYLGRFTPERVLPGTR